MKMPLFAFLQHSDTEFACRTCQRFCTAITRFTRRAHWEQQSGIFIDSASSSGLNCTRFGSNARFGLKSVNSSGVKVSNSAMREISIC